MMFEPTTKLLSKKLSQAMKCECHSESRSLIRLAELVRIAECRESSISKPTCKFKMCADSCRNKELLEVGQK